jgi:hypothetical protein
MAYIPTDPHPSPRPKSTPPQGLEASPGTAGVTFGEPYLPNKLMASSARTPPVMEIGAKGDFAATSAQGIIGWSIFFAS